MFLASAIATASLRIRPCVAPRLCVMCSSYTSRPSTTWDMCASAPAASRKISGRVSHSACQPPRPRSCSCTIAVSMRGNERGNANRGSEDDRGADRIAFVRQTWTSRRGRIQRARELRRFRFARAAKYRAQFFPACRPAGQARWQLPRNGRDACARECWARFNFRFEANAAATAGPFSPSAASVPTAPPNCSVKTSFRACAMRAWWR